MDGVQFFVANVLSAIFLISTVAGKSELELMFSDNEFQLVGVAVSSSGRLFTNYPLWTDKYKYAVVEIVNGTAVPYPDLAWNSWKQNQDDGANQWVCVQAVHVDDQDTLWVVDPASPKMLGVYRNAHKLVKINLAKNKVERVYNLSYTVDTQSYVNDVRVDTKSQTAYMTNSGTGGIVVVNVETGKVRQVLEEHYSVRADINFELKVDHKRLKKNGAPVVMHSDGIALTPDSQWLYYKPLSDDKLYRIKTEDVKNESLSPPQLGLKVEDLGHQAVSDGLVCDAAGNVYLCDPTSYSIKRFSPNKTLSTFVADSRLIWPDSFAMHDGYLYQSNSQIHKGAAYNEGVDKRTEPYTINRIKLN